MMGLEKLSLDSTGPISSYCASPLHENHADFSSVSSIAVPCEYSHSPHEMSGWRWGADLAECHSGPTLQFSLQPKSLQQYNNKKLHIGESCGFLTNLKSNRDKNDSA